MTHLDPSITSDEPPPDADGTWQGEPHPPPTTDPDATVADPHSFDVVDLSGSDDEKQGEATGPYETNIYNQGDDCGIDWQDVIMWLLWAVVGLVAILAVAFTINHMVSAQHEGYMQHQKTLQQLSKERADVASACSHDDNPRNCIQDDIPLGQ
jgi:hypothetical protein